MTKSGRVANVFLLLSFLVPLYLFGNSHGFKYIRNYSRQEYKQHPQNWAVIQDKRGVIFIGNQGGLLEFDGISWRHYTVPGWSVRSIAIGADNNVYIGGRNEIGYFTPDAGGKLSYRSLTEILDAPLRNFGVVRRTLAAKEGIWFWSTKYLLLWNYRVFKVWKAKHKFDSASLCDGTLFIRENRVGLMQIKDGTLTLVPGGSTMAHAQIYMLAPHGKGKYLLATRSSGCYLYDGSAISSFVTEADEFFKKQRLYHGIRLASGDYALATMTGGLVIMSPDGKVKRLIDKEYGLQSNIVQYVYEDFQGNLWLGLGYGISKIEYNSPFSVFDKRSNAPNVVLSVVRNRQHLYVGTTGGLHLFTRSTNRFQSVPGMKAICWDLLKTGNFVLAAANDGVFRVDSHGAVQKMLDRRAYVLVGSGKKPGRIWAGLSSGLAALDVNKVSGQDTKPFTVNIENQAIRTVIEDDYGDLWLGPLTGGIIKISFPGKNDTPVLKYYNESHGLPEREIRVFKASGHIVFASEKGIYRFDTSNERFVPDNTLGNTFAGGEKGRLIFHIAEDIKKNIFFHSLGWNYRAVPNQYGTFQVDRVPFLRLPRVQANAIIADGPDIWFAGNDALICFDAAFQKDYRPEFHTLIRRVIVKGGHVIFDGNSGGREIEPVLTAAERNLRFEFSAPFFEGEESTQYRWLLEGYDEK
ncbi:MAG: hypothetical protein GY757_40755 [bacterium]|nr:hypothetical protein [bacterium]